MKKTGCIYKITNIKDNRVYIGQTSLVNPIKRWEQHYNQAINSNNDLYLYKAIRKHGIENFSFQIIENNIPISELDKKEKEYISFYESNKRGKGYNLTDGGNTSIRSKINEKQAIEIIELLKKNISIKEIALKYNISPSSVSDINCGDSWGFSYIKYPIRKHTNNKKNFSNDEIKEIYSLLNQEKTYSYIAQKFNTSIQTISKINKGQEYFSNNISYPISKNNTSFTHLDSKQIENIVHMLLTTNKNYNEISNILKIGRKTISNINNGKAYIDILKELNITDFPIRK